MERAEVLEAARAAPYAPILAALDAWTERAARVFPAVARGAADLRAQIAVVRGAGERIEAPLFILLAGGTGVGKSTLLNALAGGEPIAETSPVRPTTTALTCWYHGTNELAIAGDLFAAARRAPHAREALRDKVVVDAPDFDATVRENEALFRHALDAADLVVFVTTPEKYLDLVAFRVLADYRRGRAFLFVMNQLDRGVAPEVVDDYRKALAHAGFVGAEVLVLSALAAFRRKRGDPEPGPEGDFARLEAHIEHELTRARMRKIKRLNLHELVARLLERAAERVPEDLAGRLAAWRTGADRIAEEARAAVAGSLSRAVREDRALREALEARIATAYGGPFGFWQALRWAVRALRGRGFGAREGAGALEAAALAEEGEERVEAAVHLAARRIDDLALEVGLARPAHALEREEAARFVAAARALAREEIAAALAAERDRRRPLESFALNLPIAGVLVYALVTWALAFADGRVIASSYFAAALLAAAIVAALLGYVVDRLAARRARRAIASLAAAASEAARREVAAPLLGRLERTIGEAEALGAEVARLKEEHATLAVSVGGEGE